VLEERGVSDTLHCAFESFIGSVIRLVQVQMFCAIGPSGVSCDCSSKSYISSRRPASMECRVRQADVPGLCPDSCKSLGVVMTSEWICSNEPRSSAVRGNWVTVT
jgi:hypothetical protein